MEQQLSLFCDADFTSNPKHIPTEEYNSIVLQSKVSKDMFTDFIAAIYKQNGCLYFTKTVNPVLGLYREKSDKWMGTSHNLKGMSEKESSRMMGGAYFDLLIAIDISENP